MLCWWAGSSGSPQFSLTYRLLIASSAPLTSRPADPLGCQCHLSCHHGRMAWLQIWRSGRPPVTGMHGKWIDMIKDQSRFMQDCQNCIKYHIWSYCDRDLIFQSQLSEILNKMPTSYCDWPKFMSNGAVYTWILIHVQRKILVHVLTDSNNMLANFPPFHSGSSMGKLYICPWNFLCRESRYAWMTC